jgi:hypothetical protein
MTLLEKLCNEIKEADGLAFDFAFDAHNCHLVGCTEEAKESEVKAKAWESKAQDLRNSLANLLVYPAQ